MTLIPTIDMIKFDEFDHADRSAWVVEAERLLKGRPLSKLIWSYEPNLPLEPYYDRLANSQSLAQVLRSNSSNEGFRKIEILDFEEEIDKRSLNALNMGADGVLLKVKDRLFDPSKLGSVLPEHCWFGVVCSQQDLSEVYSFLNSRKVDKDSFFGHISTPWLINEASLTEFEIDLNGLLESYKIFESFKNISTIEIPLHLIQQSGASISLELSTLLGLVKIIIDYARHQNIAIDGLMRKMQISVAVGTDFYHEVAKIRAVRKLIYKLFRAYNIPCSIEDISIIGRTSKVVESSLDSDTNYLRKTTQAMSIVLGTADALIVTPYEPQGYDEDSRRIARNIGNLIKEESYGHWVQDPLAGSYYVEELTEKLGEAGWERFRKVEANGGLETWVEDGKFSETIKSDQEKTYQEVNSRQRTLVGVNNYPNPVKSNHIGKQTEAFRYSAKFEALRSSVEQAIADGKIDKLPGVQPVAVGTNAAMITARLNFLSNFLGCGGFQMLELLSVENLGDSSADIVVICGADKDYELLSADWIAVLKQKSKMVLLAGQPENGKQLTENGIDMMIHMRSDVLSTNSEILKALKVV